MRQLCHGWTRLESKRCPNAKRMSFSQKKESKRQNWQTKAILNATKSYLRSWRKFLTLKLPKCKLIKLGMHVPGQEPSKRDRQKLIKDWATPNLSHRSPMAAIRSEGPDRVSPSLKTLWSEIAHKNAQLYQCLKMTNWSTSWSVWSETRSWQAPMKVSPLTSIDTLWALWINLNKQRQPQCSQCSTMKINTSSRISNTCLKQRW